jgi:CubicO group peptidase (beta-lactamase class C family)
MPTNRVPQLRLQRRKAGATDLNRLEMRVVTLRRAVPVNRHYLFYPPILREACASLIFAVLLKSPAALAAIQASDCARAAKHSESRHGASMLVTQNGRTVFEHYANGRSASRRWPIFSGTKSFWGIAGLAAVHDGLFRLDDPVSDTITEWKSDPRKSQITIRQLLSQTDGIEGASYLQRSTIRDRNAMAIRLPVIAEPGTAFIYGPSHLQVFSELLRRKLRGRSVISYFEAHVSSQLGLHGLIYKKDARGNPLCATGFELTAREWARLGELVIGSGEYHGRQIVPANLLREAFIGSQANPAYGLTFWLNEQSRKLSGEADMERMLELPWQNAQWNGVCICKDAPADMVVALGSHYQRLFIIPSLKAIIVRQGSGGNFSDAQFLRLVLGRTQ